MKEQPQLLSDMLEQLNRLWNNGDLAVVEEIMAPDVVRHDPNQGLIEGRKAFAAYVRDLRVQYPDLIITFEDTLVEKDCLVSHWQFSGTDLGRHAASGKEPTGHRVIFKGVDVLRLEEGKIVEDFVYFDRLHVLQQLGLLPENIA